MAETFAFNVCVCYGGYVTVRKLGCVCVCYVCVYLCVCVCACYACVYLCVCLSVCFSVMGCHGVCLGRVGQGWLTFNCELFLIGFFIFLISYVFYYFYKSVFKFLSYPFTA